MKWILAAALFLYSINLRADIYREEIHLPDNKRIVFVPLGCDCMVALQLREQGLRFEAFPFDWNFSFLLDKVIQLLNDDFQYFLDPDHLKITSPQEVMNFSYMIEFKHEGPFFDQQRKTISSEAYNKYQRRISRFRDLRNYPGKVIFIRSAFDYYRFPFHDYGDERMGMITTAEAMALEKTLERYFPSLDFTLVIINYDTPATPPILAIDKVIEYKISSRHKRRSYTEIFNELLLMFDCKK